MAPRKRLRRNSDLPENLYCEVRNGVPYFRYRRPDTRTWHTMGSIKPEAVAAARQLNGLLSRERDLIGSVLGTADQTMSHLIDRYRKEHLADKELAASTLQNINYRLNRFDADMNRELIESRDVKTISEYLDSSFTRDSYVKHRNTLVELFRFAQTKGLYPADQENPAEVTFARSDVKKKRKRMTPAQFAAIHAISPSWMQIAMELALITLQGRYEVIGLKFSQFDQKTGTIRVIRQKVEKHEHAYLEIESSRLAGIISRARRSGIASPYIVHREPVRRNTAQDREHWSQLTANHFSSEFRRLRDLTGIFDTVERRERPTFHEIRALGSWLYKQQGYDNESYIQPLMAHADQKMTEHYQKGHEQQWVKVRADLDVSDILGH